MRNDNKVVLDKLILVLPFVKKISVLSVKSVKTL